MISYVHSWHSAILMAKFQKETRSIFNSVSIKRRLRKVKQKFKRKKRIKTKIITKKKRSLKRIFKLKKKMKQHKDFHQHLLLLFNRLHPSYNLNLINRSCLWILLYQSILRFQTHLKLQIFHNSKKCSKKLKNFLNILLKNKVSTKRK